MINEDIHTVGLFADKAFDKRDLDTLHKIAEDCLNWVESGEYNLLEKGILAYHGATSYSNYIYLKYKGTLSYSENINNEQDFEMCLLLFRLSIENLTYYQANEDIKEESEEFRYVTNYLLMAYTNYANLLNTCGRMIKALSYSKIGVERNFSMAIGNYAGFLMDYAIHDYDNGHQAVFANKSYHLLKEVLELEELDENATEHYTYLKNKLEQWYPTEFLEKRNELKEYSFGDSEDEINYRKWCVENFLFLNTLNDAFPHSISANDILHLPDIISKIDEGSNYHGLFNQIKQEYVSARFMVYDALSFEGAHFSDKDVHLVNTLDYPTYGISIEKMKYSYRSLYSLFDRIAFFINEYFEIGIKERDVSYRSIWQGSVNKGKNSYDLKVNLKSKMTGEETFNLPLVGLYWLCKDIGKEKVKHHYIEPAIEHISKIRHHLEHRYLKVHDSLLYPIIKDSFPKREDPLAFSITVDEFKDAAMKLITYVREGIILLTMAVHLEEQNKRKKEDSYVSMHMDRYDDNWKQLL
ncbi:LA2681 family HEPN domain-containing protein [Brevibacillus brevis]|uniref:LA2681 family HEPN domain-containing protein n=1 Tax=Brevibacillus brevis TaxID=1393 RepID=UPI0007D8AD6D|nr:LA2681 family HEPN domain-containing protein [Brevibacillus brevis]